MSRHRLEHKTKPNLYEVFVGWDRPMNTFFGQVFDIPTQEDDDTAETDLIFWTGKFNSEVLDVDTLFEKMEEHITEKEFKTIKSRLIADKGKTNAKQRKN